MSRAIYYAPLIGLLIWAAIVDVRARRIPNWISFGLMLSGLGLSLLPWGRIPPAQAALGLAAGFALPLVLHVLGAIGAGDVKLLAGVGAWIGPVPVLVVFAGAALIGMVLAIVKMIQPARVDAAVIGAKRAVTLPFALAIAMATVALVAGRYS